MADIISLTEENIDTEHICCAISDKNGETCVFSKKSWLKERFQDGLVFKKLAVRGKVFIEYIPAEKAWVPLDASGYMHINCFWVSGQFKGQGFSNLLLEACINDAKLKGCRGITAISSAKKRPFLSDGNHLKYKGFMLADNAPPFYELLHLPFGNEGELPKFKSCVKVAPAHERGLVLYYSHQCPFAEKYALIFKTAAKQRGVAMALHKLESVDQAQNAPSPSTTYSLFNNGVFVTNEILSEKKIETFLSGIPG